MDLNLTLINPYLDKSADFSNGVNFAVAGATALDRSALLVNGIAMPPASVPLSSQLEWFNSYLNSTCTSQSGIYSSKSIFYVSYLLFKQHKSFVPSNIKPNFIFLFIIVKTVKFSCWNYNETKFWELFFFHFIETLLAAYAFLSLEHIFSLKKGFWTIVDCAKKLEQALFLVGEIGGNDYNYAFFQGTSLKEATNYVPQVVQAIIDAAKVTHCHALEFWK
jgi:hypothetical protein